MNGRGEQNAPYPIPTPYPNAATIEESSRRHRRRNPNPNEPPRAPHTPPATTHHTAAQSHARTRAAEPPHLSPIARQNESRYAPEFTGQTSPNPAKLVTSTAGESRRLRVAEIVASTTGETGRSAHVAGESDGREGFRSAMEEHAASAAPCETRRSEAVSSDE